MSEKMLFFKAEKIEKEKGKWRSCERNWHLRKRLQFLLAPSFKKVYSKDKQYV